jgi:hypothetical protein
MYRSAAAIAYLEDGRSFLLDNQLQNLIDAGLRGEMHDNLLSICDAQPSISSNQLLGAREFSQHLVRVIGEKALHIANEQFHGQYMSYS